MHGTKISAEFEFGGRSILGAHPPQKNVALGYDVGKISAGCLVAYTYAETSTRTSLEQAPMDWGNVSLSTSFDLAAVIQSLLIMPLQPLKNGAGIRRVCAYVSARVPKTL